jgi:hypothetical protein
MLPMPRFVRLAEVDRQQLGVAVGHVQQADLAEARQVVHAPGGLGGLGRVAVQRQAAGRGDGQHLEEIPAVHGHAELSVQSLFTGDSGSTRKATMWVICSGVSQLCSPKRGMLVHAVKALEL